MLCIFANKDIINMFELVAGQSCIGWQVNAVTVASCGILTAGMAISTKYMDYKIKAPVLAKIRSFYTCSYTTLYYFSHLALQY